MTIARRTGVKVGIFDEMKARSSLPAQPAYDDLVQLARDLTKGRIGHVIDGKLHVAMPCGVEHAHTMAELSATLLAGSPLGDCAPADWTFLTEVELWFRSDTLIVADIAGWRAPHDRIVALPNPIVVVPQWICEVLDPGNRHKRQAYALAGVESLWILDPVARVLEAYENQRGRWVLESAVSEDEAAPLPFPELRFDVGDLWLPTSNAPTSNSRQRAKR